jgi:DHA1 family bicyclomycin/chloramphenicol resistance-like MFS transporter
MSSPTAIETKTGAAAGAFCHPGMSFREFVLMMAALMAVNAISIDPMLPVLPQIADTLHIKSENATQWVVTAYLLGFGGAQLIYGPIADRYGRKPVLLFGLAVYALFTVLAAFAPSLPVMIAARLLQGSGAAATRVLATTIVRDCYAGRQMARVMSLVFIVFLAAPVIAPTIGQAIASVSSWQWIFGMLACFGIGTAIWAWARLPESLHADDRIPISFAGVGHALRVVGTSRIAVGYMLAATCIMGALFSFINSAQQVFSDVFHAEALFTTVFAIVASCMAVSSFLNSRIVERYGMRHVSHAALLGFIVFAAVHCVLSLSGHETVWTFAIAQGGLMFCFGLVGANFNALAMEPLGHVAGTGSSVLGFVTVVGGALIGFFVGQHFNGSTVPLDLGFLACGLVALAITLVTENGVLFRRH